MIPYESNLATAVPEALDVRLAIIRAIGAHKEQCDNERARLRRAEIAFLRHELKGIAQDLRKVGRECLFLIRSELRKAGFKPNEPRVPAGNPPTAGSGRTTAALPLTSRKFSRMRPMADGYRAPNMQPTGATGSQKRFMENIHFGPKRRKFLTIPRLDRLLMTASIAGTSNTEPTMKPSMRPSPRI